MIKVVSSTYAPVDFADSPINFLDGGVMNKYQAIHTIVAAKYTQQKNLQLTGNTITNIDGLDFESFLDLDLDGSALLIGEQIKLPGSTLNTGTLTITAVTATTITVSTSLTTETIAVCPAICVVNLITALDMYYNIIGNTESESYYSKTDTGVLQKYTVSGLNAASGTPIAFNIGTKSFAWVTDAVTGIVSTSTIAGGGIANAAGFYAQTFVITHNFFQAPFWLSSQMGNFQNNQPPYYYFGSTASTGVSNGNGLQYIALFNGKYNSTDTVPQHYGHIFNQNGTSTWLNSNNAGTAPDYTKVSTSYIDNATGNPLTAIDCTKTVNVTIILNSQSGAFTTSTKIVLAHLYCPLTDVDYKNTSTTLLQNLMHDRAVLTAQSPASPMPTYTNGEQYGTDYSIVQHALAIVNNVNTITITCKMIYAVYLQAFLIARPGNKNYGLIATTE